VGAGALDADGSGDVGALTDGVLVMRYLFGFRDEVLARDAVDLERGTRLSGVDVAAFLEGRLPQGAAPETGETASGEGAAPSVTDELFSNFGR
jgi:hypothetical protein